MFRIKNIIMAISVLSAVSPAVMHTMEYYVSETNDQIISRIATIANVQTNDGNTYLVAASHHPCINCWMIDQFGNLHLTQFAQRGGHTTPIITVISVKTDAGIYVVSHAVGNILKLWSFKFGRLIYLQTLVKDIYSLSHSLERPDTVIMTTVEGGYSFWRVIHNKLVCIEE